ncbi:MAG TPA: N-acetylglucosamine-6-phosphate deacetylase [Dehalococcoidia bacterium]|nr:N-acetylglucosamine-6-phosphate deacetylase [Dehalococcoidia bacterium]
MLVILRRSPKNLDMSLWYVRARKLVTPAGVIEAGAVRVDDGRIDAVGSAWDLIPPSGRLPPDTTVISAAIVMPGFIDLHVHGFGGLALGGGAEAAREASRLVASTGVTTWYAGLGHGATFEEVEASVVAAASVVGSPTGGARLAGIFMEGPYISVEKRGAWNAAHLRSPSLAELARLVEASGRAIRRFNVAPELPGALDFIRAARERGIAVSLGHSNATYEQALAGIEAGASIANHTYNAMSGLDHRAPGLVGAALSRDELLAELILDGVHVHPAAARALFRARGAAGVALITDGSQMTGMADGTYERGGRTLIVAGGACRLPDGTLAGSISTFDRDLRNARAWLTDDLCELAAMSATNAARTLGIDGETGTIAPGLRADLVLMDEGLNVQATVVAGEVVWRQEGAVLEALP